jgi:hypothetical protein
LQQRGGQSITGGLQGIHITNSQEGVVHLSESHAVAATLLGDRRVAVE